MPDGNDKLNAKEERLVGALRKRPAGEVGSLARSQAKLAMVSGALVSVGMLIHGNIWGFLFGVMLMSSGLAELRRAQLLRVIAILSHRSPAEDSGASATANGPSSPQPPAEDPSGALRSDGIKR